MGLSGSASLAPLPLRLAAGAIFCFHGYKKLFVDDIEKFVASTRDFGFGQYGDVLAQVAAWGEFVGGIMLILGVATRLAALVNAGTMFVAIWKVHLGPDILDGIKHNLSGPNGYELPLILFAACWALILMGGGALSADGFFVGRNRNVTPAQ